MIQFSKRVHDAQSCVYNFFEFLPSTHTIVHHFTHAMYCELVIATDAIIPIMQDGGGPVDQCKRLGTSRVSSRNFCLGGRVCKDQLLCEACKIFDVPYAHFRVSITNARKNMKPEFLLLDIVLIVKLLGTGGGGGEVGGFG